MRKWTVAFTAIFLLLLTFDLVPQLHRAWDMDWPYKKPSNWGAIAILGGLLAIYLAGVGILRLKVTRAWPSLLWSTLAGFVLCLGIQHIRYDDPFFMLFAHTVSPVQTGGSAVAVNYMGREGVSDTLRRWPEVMREAADKAIAHFTTSPPGQPLLHHWIARLIDPVEPVSRPLSMALRSYQCSTADVMYYTRGEMVSAGVGMLMPLWAALAVIPIFFIGQNLLQNRQVALRIAQWWPLVPSLLVFAPHWSTFYPLCIASVSALFDLGLRQRRPAYIVLSGVLMSMTTFFNFAVLPVLPFLGFYTLGYWYFIVRLENTTSTWEWLVLKGLWFGVGLSTVWLAYGLYTGLTPYDILSATFDYHYTIRRNYFLWVFLHLYETLMFAGWPLAIAGIWGIRLTLKRLRARVSVRSFDVFVMAFSLTIVILDISGITRGESARIWLFFVPFLLLASADLFERSRWWDMPLLVAQAASVAIMGAVFPVMVLDMNPPPGGPRSDVATLDFASLQPLGWQIHSTDYEGRFTLAGYRFVADPARQTLTIEFLWRGIQRTERPYQFELVAHAENELDGQIESRRFRWYPQNGNYLTTCWQAGDQIHDVVVMPLPPVSQPVIWTLTLTIFDERTGDMPEITLAGKVVQPAVLGPVSYP